MAFVRNDMDARMLEVLELSLFSRTGISDMFAFILGSTQMLWLSFQAWDKVVRSSMQTYLPDSCITKRTVPPASVIANISYR